MKLPQSATHGGTALAGILSFLLSVAVVYINKPAFNLVCGGLFIITLTASVIFASDIIWQQVHLRQSAGLDFSQKKFSWERSIYKFIGFTGSLGFVAFFYWLFPEYHGTFYDNYYALLKIILPTIIIIALPYIIFVDCRMIAPLDGYWHMGRFISLQWNSVDFSILRQHLLSWLIKGFFLPLMFTYFCNDLNIILSQDFKQLAGFKSHYDFLYNVLYFIDVGLVSMGYIFTLRIFDTHVRSAEPTMLGWVVALICYEPFWSLFGTQYISYDSGHGWGQWLSDKPLLYDLWGSAIIALIVIYAWATVIFGARFSNLTHRGIITNGPYRYTKHPAYIAKNLSWWMISVPFLMQGTYYETLRHCLLLLLLNGIYLMRARTEELHLSRDSAYTNYALWIEENGIFRFVGKLPFLSYTTYAHAGMEKAS